MKINDKNGLLKVSLLVNKLLEELDQTANGPELDQEAAELKNEATEEKAPSELTSDINNEDVYGDDEESAEDVEEVIVESEHSILAEDELETEVLPAEAEEKGVADDKPAERGEEEDKSEELESDDEAEEVESEEKPEEDKSKELESDDEAEEVESEEEKDEDKEEDDEEELKESAIFKLINQINESISQMANGPELDQEAAELKNEATEEKAEEHAAEKDNEDVYPEEEHKEAEDVKEVVVEAAENEATEEKAEECVAEKDNEDVYPEEEHKEAEDVAEVVIEAAENEATEEREPEVEVADTENEDVYCDDCHKQVEDVVEVVVEAVSVCKAKGVPATLKNITEAAAALFETKNFDIDAFIMSKEMNGSDKFEEYEKLEGKGAEAGLTALRESVKYTSLKEACMLDEGYFAEDSYTKETAAEKVQKLTEQVGLLIAREANDPLYDELLKESAYCMRLREQIQNKYKKQAAVKVEKIIE